jgi:hypothetical protein
MGRQVSRIALSEKVPRLIREGPVRVNASRQQWSGIGVGLRDEAIDGFLQIDD